MKYIREYNQYEEDFNQLVTILKHELLEDLGIEEADPYDMNPKYDSFYYINYNNIIITTTNVNDFEVITNYVKHIKENSINIIGRQIEFQISSNYHFDNIKIFFKEIFPKILFSL